MPLLTWIYAASHFAVDLACAYAAFSGNQLGAAGFLYYNFFAFALQMPLGLLADRIGKNRSFAIIGTVLIFLCCCFSPLPPFAMCLLGLGNALFHIGGGLDVLNLSGQKAAPLGIFVSPGALGVYLGALTHGHAAIRYLILLLLLLAAVAMILGQKTPLPANAPLTLPRRQSLIWAAGLFLVVVLRSFGGMAVTLPWKTGLWSLAATIAVVLGKACGGFLCDRFGAAASTVCSLLLCAAMFLLADIPGCGLLALLLFNMTMPITLFALAQAMPGCKGFSFGLLTFALFLGFLPICLSSVSLSGAAMSAVSLLSLLLMIPSVKHCLSAEKGELT